MVPNGPKTVPKWCQNRSKFVPKLSLGDCLVQSGSRMPKLAGKLTQNWRSHANLAPRWIKLEPSLRPDVPT